MSEIFKLDISTKGNDDVIDITEEVQEKVSSSKKTEGIAVIFLKGSTGSITTIEYEPNLVKDLKDALERIAPSGIEYRHHKTWGDWNGKSHIRSSILGPSLSIPFTKGKLLLGTWQQIVFIDHDTRPRKREIFICIY